MRTAHFTMPARRARGTRSANNGGMEPSRRRFLAPVPAGALAFGLAIGLALPLGLPWLRPAPRDADLPDGYVGVLAAPEGGTGLVVSAWRRGHVLDTQLPDPPAMPAGRMLYLWTVDVSGAAMPLGPVPAGRHGRIALPERADTYFERVVAFGVSVERSGEQPQRPDTGFVWRGACGRLWPSPTHGA